MIGYTFSCELHTIMPKIATFATPSTSMDAGDVEDVAKYVLGKVQKLRNGISSNGQTIVNMFCNWRKKKRIQIIGGPFKCYMCGVPCSKKICTVIKMEVLGSSVMSATL